ncbi:MAG: lipopolysaccharide kinase InaA family protein [Desulfobacterales bacterium]|nr:lipopolysaccharide kinase InaA family protein [Desulfobacterales bacterium]
MRSSLRAHNDFIAAHWLGRLESQGLTDFERLWQRRLPLVDKANTSRGGRSTVALLVAEPAGAQDFRLIVKRQQNHQSRTWRHPLQGIPTVNKEYFNFRRFNACGLATASPVLFAQRQDSRGRRAILVTEYLEGYCSFDALLKRWSVGSAPADEYRDTILRSIANLIARMHRAGFRHNCLYPKHVFVNRQRPRPDVRLIDLEKAGRALGSSRRMIRDLDAFFRNSPCWSSSDQARFLVHYHGESHLTPKIEQTWRRIQRRMARKGGPVPNLQPGSSDGDR